MGEGGGNGQAVAPDPHRSRPRPHGRCDGIIGANTGRCRDITSRIAILWTAAQGSSAPPRPTADNARQSGWRLGPAAGSGANRA